LYLSEGKKIPLVGYKNSASGGWHLFGRCSMLMSTLHLSLKISLKMALQIGPKHVA